MKTTKLSAYKRDAIDLPGAKYRRLSKLWWVKLTGQAQVKLTVGQVEKELREYEQHQEA